MYWLTEDCWKCYRLEVDEVSRFKQIYCFSMLQLEKFNVQIRKHAFFDVILSNFWF